MSHDTLSQAPLRRKLAAILAADFVGYSRLMHADEERTVATLAHHRRILDETIAAGRGAIVGTAGDSVLAEFDSVMEAYRCAVAIQQALRKANAELPEEEQLHLRIGINIGDVMVVDGEMFGDGVNIACRVEGMASPGGVCVTRGVRDHLRDHVDTPFEDLGEQDVKNIARPIRVFRAIFDADAEPQLPQLPAEPEGTATSDEAAGPISAPLDSAVELAFWQTVQASDEDDEYRLYLERFPDGVFAHLARSRLESGGATPRKSDDTMVEVAFWETVKDSGKPEMVRAYLEKYPNGEFKPLAEIMLAGLS